MRRAPTRTPQERADFQHQMDILTEQANTVLTVLAETDATNALSTHLIGAAASVQRLSLRNQARLAIQAADRNITLGDVDTFQGWRRRGRVPTQPGLRIVRPHDEPGAAESGGSGAQAHRPEFRVGYRWDFSQTAPLDTVVNPQPAPQPAGDPAAFVTHLIDQLNRAGYRVNPGETTGIDHQAPSVTIDAAMWQSDPVGTARALITALAGALTHRQRVRVPVAG